MDLINLAQTLIRFKSITPDDDGCLDYIISLLKPLGAQTKLYQKEGVSTLHAVIGKGEKKLCFVGHVDVVPVGSNWTYPPFEGVIDQGRLYGRGAVDMKGAISAFLFALFKKTYPYEIHLVLTSDEEGPAIYGTRLVVSDLPLFDCILIGEPSNPTFLGEMIKIGRRGSLNGQITFKGKGGHIADTKTTLSPVSLFLSDIHKLLDLPLDKDTSIQMSSLSTDTHVCNMIPSTLTVQFNIRFSHAYTSHQLMKDIQERLALHAVSFSLPAAEPFYSKEEKCHDLLKDIVLKHTGHLPLLSSTSGGTSDGRFMKDLGPIAEFGLVGTLAHKADEYLNISDLIKLSKIYESFLRQFF